MKSAVEWAEMTGTLEILADGKAPQNQDFSGTPQLQGMTGGGIIRGNPRVLMESVVCDGDERVIDVIQMVQRCDTMNPL